MRPSDDRPHPGADRFASDNTRIPHRIGHDRLASAGLKHTRQRALLATLLFGHGDRHVTAEMLFAEASAHGETMALGTVYNTLNQFTQAGLLRRIGLDVAKSVFDTNTLDHPHFYLEDEDILIDAPAGSSVPTMPDVPPGHEFARLDLVIHIRRTPSRR